MPLFGCCIRKVVDVKSLDYRHSGLSNVPNAVFNAVHTIETLYLDSNQIKSLPRVSVLSNNTIMINPPELYHGERFCWLEVGMKEVIRFVWLFRYQICRKTYR